MWGRESNSTLRPSGSDFSVVAAVRMASAGHPCGRPAIDALKTGHRNHRGGRLPAVQEQTGRQASAWKPLCRSLPTRSGRSARNESARSRSGVCTVTLISPARSAMRMSTLFWPSAKCRETSCETGCAGGSGISTGETRTGVPGAGAGLPGWVSPFAGLDGELRLAAGMPLAGPLEEGELWGEPWGAAADVAAGFGFPDTGAFETGAGRPFSGVRPRRLSALSVFSARAGSFPSASTSGRRCLADAGAIAWNSPFPAFPSRGDSLPP